jgi:hypothetical protein
MGRSRFLHCGLIALLLAACSSADESLLQASSIKPVYEGAQGSKFKPSSLEEGVRGTITGKVHFEGRPYRTGLIDLGGDDACINLRPNGLKSEDFRINPDGTLEGVIVYVKEGLSVGFNWPAPSEPLVLDQVGCQYIPHVAVLQTGQTLIIKSDDPFLHNVNGAAGPNPGFNHAMSGVGELPPKTFTKTEVAKLIKCDVHGWMKSYVAVLPHPFHDITGADGTFTLGNVPPGTYKLGAWHEKLGELEAEVKLEPNGTLTNDFTFERK